MKTLLLSLTLLLAVMAANAQTAKPGDTLSLYNSDNTLSKSFPAPHNWSYGLEYMPRHIDGHVLDFSATETHPGPLANETKIKYKLPEYDGSASLIVYDLKSVQVKNIDLNAPAGTLVLQHGDLPAGTYYYVIKSGKTVYDGQTLVTVK